MSFQLLKSDMTLGQVGNCVLIGCASEDDAIALFEALQAIDKGEFNGCVLHSNGLSDTLCQGDS